METRKRKYTKSEDEILAKFKDAKITECSVNLVQMDIAPLLLLKKPLSEKDIERMLKDSESNASDSDSEQVISPRSKNRLRKKENGMVFIPRSKYNEHPAKNILSPRKSKRNASKSVIKVKLSPRVSKKKNSSSPKVSKNNNSIFRKNSSLGKSTPNKYKNNKASNAKKHKSPMKNITEYHLVFSPPKDANKKKNNVVKPAASLSDFMKIECLPSKLWEIERVPPLIPNVENDSIAKELFALTEENKENLIDSSDTTHVTKGAVSRHETQEADLTETLSQLVDSENPSEVRESKDADEISKKEDDRKVEKSVRDELEALLSDTEPKPSNVLEDTTAAESEITKEDIEKTLQDVEMEATSSTETVEEIIGNVIKTVILPDTNKVEDTNMAIESGKKIDTDLDITESTNSPTKETEDKQLDKKDDTSIADIDEDSDKHKQLTQSKKERSVHFEEDMKNGKSDEDSIITSLIFRKYSENKKTYEKVVVFQSSMEYTVTINNKTVELIGAPEEMASMEDLSILLQIVDESNLDSFNVICKS